MALDPSWKHRTGAHKAWVPVPDTVTEWGGSAGLSPEMPEMLLGGLICRNKRNEQ